MEGDESQAYREVNADQLFTKMQENLQQGSLLKAIEVANFDAMKFGKQEEQSKQQLQQEASQQLLEAQNIAKLVANPALSFSLNNKLKNKFNNLVP